jgi:hypothetical protein
MGYYCYMGRRGVRFFAAYLKTILLKAKWMTIPDRFEHQPSEEIIRK